MVKKLNLLSSLVIGILITVFVVWKDRASLRNQWDEFNEIIDTPGVGAGEEGELGIYPVNQGEGVAMRTLRDDQGRRIQRVVYDPPSDSDYRAPGWEGVLDPSIVESFKIRKVHTYKYGWNGFSCIEVYKKPGRENCVVRLYGDESSDTLSTIQFDSTGTRIMGIHGLLPEFLSDKLVWSAFENGVRASFFEVRSSGTIGGRCVYYTIHNTGSETVKFTDFKVQLFDRQGQELPVDTEKRARYLRSTEGRPVWGIGEEIQPGRTYSSREFVVDWFGVGVPVGEYELKIKIQVDSSPEYLEFVVPNWKIDARWEN